ncbi:MAG: hypothetical protein BWY09_01879 [Candidatus Hydrogenedentes bacterium ADurb.Bin179]|nr:MAG: hypothetical protein BWY09_01879 [Candidatus Hydrogenedentes bacterium ADurb.Bin179]
MFLFQPDLGGVASRAPRIEVPFNPRSGNTPFFDLGKIRLGCGMLDRKGFIPPYDGREVLQVFP